MDTNIPLFRASVDELATKVEEGARANKRNIGKFIEPAQGTLRRATSRRHHLIFGRRGSGKSSLLLKAGSDLEHKGHPIALVDFEPFKGHHYPDVLISVLIATLRKYESWLSVHININKKPFLEKIFSLKKSKDKYPVAKVLQKLIKTSEELERHLYMNDNASLTITTKSSQEQHSDTSLKGKSNVKSPAINSEIESQIAASLSSQISGEIREEVKRVKQDFLHRKIIEFQQIFRELTESTGFASFLFLDDLYHLHRSDQASVLDYFHRIAKNNDLWLKIGTIKNRSTWYVHGPQPIGLKIGDDADEINLDVTLEKFSTSKEFLLKIIGSYAIEVNAPHLPDFIYDGGFDRMVMASGGVTRDFLGIFRRSIDEARERATKNPNHPRGPKIFAEDVNVAAGAYGDTKKEEFQRDTLEDRAKLEVVFEKVRYFCLIKNKSNVFLIDQDGRDEDHDFIQELIDLRLVHHIRSRVTVGNRPGKVYRALLLDVSQYTGERKRRGVEMVEFWRTNNKDLLRRPQFIFDPSISLQEMEEEIRESMDNISRKESVDESNNQMDLSF